MSKKFVSISDATPQELAAAGLPADFHIGIVRLEVKVASFVDREEEFEAVRKIGITASVRPVGDKSTNLDKMIQQALRK